MTTFNYKQGDEAPPLEYRLKDSDNDRIDLSEADSVKIYIDDGDGTLIANDTATVTNAEQGEVSYEFGDELNASPGRYRAEFVIYWTDGRDQTVPSRGFLSIQIAETTARDAAGGPTFDDPDAELTTLFVDEIATNSGGPIALQNDLDGQGTASLTDFESIGADEALIKNKVDFDSAKILYDTLSIDDDDVVTLDATSNKKMEVIGQRDSSEVGIFFTSFGGVTTVASKGMSNEGGVSLSGTTGPDGTLNVSRVDNTYYFENRTGDDPLRMPVLRWRSDVS